MIHALICLPFILLAALFGPEWAGYVVAAMFGGFYLGRELAQAEYRWIEWFGGHRRANMPWWGQFDPRVWNFKSLLDCAAPLTLAILVISILLAHKVGVA